MTGKRFETGVHINVGTEGLVIQQTAGATSMPLQILSHDATPVFMVHTTGEVTAPMGVNIGAATKTEIETLSGVTSNVQTQIDAKAPTASPTFTGTVTLPSLTSIGNVSSTEIGYIDGVTSSIQVQIDSKSPSATPNFTGTVTIPTLNVTGNSTVGTIISGIWQGSVITSSYLPASSTSASGVVQLSDSTTSTSTSLAATGNSVRQSSRDDLIQFYMEVI